MGLEAHVGDGLDSVVAFDHGGGFAEEPCDFLFLEIGVVAFGWRPLAEGGGSEFEDLEAEVLVRVNLKLSLIVRSHLVNDAVDANSADIRDSIQVLLWLGKWYGKLH